MTKTSTRIAAALAGAAVVAALASCGTATEKATNPGAGEVAASSAAQAATHNSDDVMFAQMMIPHHQQAVELSALVPGRSSDPSLITLADAIAGQQQPEIDTMKAALQQWGVDPEKPAHGSGHAGMAMQGMVDDATIVKLEALKGSAFDELWLKSMIGHHAGAIAMAKSEIVDGKNPEMIALANNIVAAQQTEIDQMNSMLAAMAAQGG